MFKSKDFVRRKLTSSDLPTVCKKIWPHLEQHAIASVLIVSALTGRTIENISQTLQCCNLRARFEISDSSVVLIQDTTLANRAASAVALPLPIELATGLTESAKHNEAECYQLARQFCSEVLADEAIRPSRVHAMLSDGRWNGSTSPLPRELDEYNLCWITGLADRRHMCVYYAGGSERDIQKNYLTFLNRTLSDAEISATICFAEKSIGVTGRSFDLQLLRQTISDLYDKLNRCTPRTTLEIIDYHNDLVSYCALVLELSTSARPSFSSNFQFDHLITSSWVLVKDKGVDSKRKLQLNSICQHQIEFYQKHLEQIRGSRLSMTKTIRDVIEGALGCESRAFFYISHGQVSDRQPLELSAKSRRKFKGLPAKLPINTGHLAFTRYMPEYLSQCLVDIYSDHGAQRHSKKKFQSGFIDQAACCSVIASWLADLGVRKLQ
ncbi:hypothetical protein IC617_07510 [Neiella sp. HB171785]|uniref:Uncharacterized protein n=1 Tax=Neiella litorisoli TaxID=2771431 RepID=A0A8J6UPR4_9GAMM|nr:hypothetical protein [Neiella litorisoli]MBD1389267.1 hypothetical protein [Neiella litorisoli]